MRKSTQSSGAAFRMDFSPNLLREEEGESLSFCSVVF